MSLPNVNIILGSGNIGAVSLSDDGVAGLILTGTGIGNRLELGKVYVLSSTRDLETLGIAAATNPLLHKEIVAFYAAAGDGAELHLIVASESTTLTQLCAAEASSPLNKLINSAAGRIRLVGVNRMLPAEYEPTVTQKIDEDVITAVAAAHAVAEGFLAQIAPFRLFLPAIGWTGDTNGLYKPAEASYNRVAIVLAADAKIGAAAQTSAAVGQALGRAAKVAVNVSIARVRDGAVSPTGYLMDGSTPESHFAQWESLYDAGYIFYRTFVGKAGYYFCSDQMAVATTDDYNRLSLGRVIDKALVIAYKTYIDDIIDNINVDDKGKVPVPICKSFEAAIERSIGNNMAGEISSFSAFVDPAQDVISTGRLAITCKIVPTALLKEINVTLAFNNPSSN